MKSKQCQILSGKGKSSPSTHGFLFPGKGKPAHTEASAGEPREAAGTEAAGISEDAGSPGSHCQDDLQRKGLASHTPKVGPVSKSNRTFFSFIKYLDNWKVPVSGNLFQL